MAAALRPPVSVAFDDAGKPKPPALAFAKKCGVAVEDLGRLETDKGSWLAYRAVHQGQSAVELVPDLVRKALAALPIPKRMRWGDRADEFVRPVHWVVLLFGDDVIAADIMTDDLVTVDPDEDVYAALARMAGGNHLVAPVVARDGNARFLGMLNRRDIYAAVRERIEDMLGAVASDPGPEEGAVVAVGTP